MKKKKRFYVYIFVDLVKCGVLTLVSEIWHYRLIEMTIINLIIIKTLAHTYTSKPYRCHCKCNGGWRWGREGGGLERRLCPANRQKFFTVGVKSNI